MAFGKSYSSAASKVVPAEVNGNAGWQSCIATSHTISWKELPPCPANWSVDGHTGGSEQRANRRLGICTCICTYAIMSNHGLIKVHMNNFGFLRETHQHLSSDILFERQTISLHRWNPHVILHAWIYPDKGGATIKGNENYAEIPIR